MGVLKALIWIALTALLVVLIFLCSHKKSPELMDLFEKRDSVIFSYNDGVQSESITLRRNGKFSQVIMQRDRCFENNGTWLPAQDKGKIYFSPFLVRYDAESRQRLFPPAFFIRSDGWFHVANSSNRIWINLCPEESGTYYVELKEK